MAPNEVLDLPMQPNDANAKTIREYLGRLLLALWNEGEGFSGKRPLGNSGWENELYLPLVKAGEIKGRVDDDGWLESADSKAGRKVIREAICELFSAT